MLASTNCCNPIVINSLTFIDDFIARTPTTKQTTVSTFTQAQISNQTTPNYNIFPSNFQETQPVKRLRKSSSAINLLSFDEIYDKIDKFLDEQKLFVICPSPMMNRRTLTQLKPCPKFETLTCSKAKSSLLNRQFGKDIETMKADDKNKDLTKMALPSFLDKRSQFQKQNSEHFSLSISSVGGSTCGNSLDSDKSLKTSLAKFTFMEIICKEETQENGEPKFSW